MLTHFLGSVRLIAAVVLAIAGGIAVAARPVNDPGAVSIHIIENGTLIDAQVPPSSQTVGGALSLLGVETRNRFIAPKEATPIVPGMTITVLPKSSVTIRDGTNPPRTIETIARDVGSAAVSAGIIFGALDRIAPAAQIPLDEHIEIRITRVAQEERNEIVESPFSVIVTTDPELMWGKERITSAGAQGRTEEHVRIRLENGEVVKRTVISRTIINPPVPEHRVRGAKIVIGRVVEGGGSWYRFRGGDFAAATLFPRGAFLRVTNLENGRQVIVRVNDYGPTLPGRVIDLDAVAFKKIAPLWQGVVPVRVEEILSN